MLEKEMKMSGSNAGAFPRAGLERNYTQDRTAESYVRATAGGRNLFADTIIDESASDRAKRAASAGLALSIQAAILGALVLVPLLFTEGIDLDQLDNTVLLVPPSPAAPPAIHVQSIPRASLLHATLTAPTVIPKKVAMSTADAGASAPAILDMPGGVPGGVGDVLGGSLNGAPPPPPLAPAAKPKEVRIFSGMKEPALIYAPPVVYPPVARMAHISGTVVIEAIIDDRGNVIQVKAISGPALLMNAALKAVSERKYRPTILDGQPVSIRFDVKVDFKLS
jgi:protein TonB